MGLFGHTSTHESGIDHSLDTPSTSCPSTMPSSAPTPPPNTSATSSSTTSTETDSDTADLSCSKCPVHSPHTSAWSVTCESIAQRLANQNLEHQHTPGAVASTALNALAHSPTARACQATCAFTKACGRQPSTKQHHYIFLNLRHSTSSTTSIQVPPTTQVGSVRLGSVSMLLLCRMWESNMILSRCVKRRGLESC
ncbi:hypothetical protein SprV_0100154700 [Sparganum proliferum]